MAVAHHNSLSVEDMNDEEQYILEQLKAASACFKKKNLDETMDFLNLANDEMVKCGVSNIKKKIVQSVVHNRVLCLAPLVCF